MTFDHVWRGGAGASRLLGVAAMLPALAAGLGAVTGPGCGTEPARITRSTYSVMTYNIGGKPGITGYSLDNGSSCEERAAQIGQHILDMHDPPDIVVFAEATGECYKHGLIEKLHGNGGPYRSFITDLGAGSPKLQDSGLMFFSTFPWALEGEENQCEDMAVDKVFDPVGHAIYGQATGIFVQYSDLAFSDRFMAKGVGYACVHHPGTGQLVNVFFTHNQANYWIPGDNDFDDLADKERVVNMQEASKFINDHAPESIMSKRGDAVIFAGDMNIYGNDVAYWVIPDAGTDTANGMVEVEDVVTPARVAGMQEYADLIGPGGLLAIANGLRDPWRTDGTAFPATTVFDSWGTGGDMGFVYDPVAVNTTDMGFTWDALRNGQTENDETRARLDYILDRQVSFRENSNCYEQMTVERGFVYTANPQVQKAYVGMDLSDHYPLRAVIGPHETFCSPSLAPKDKLGAIPVTVANGGARKWFFYSTPGTYVIDAATTSPLDVHVYAASDLSTDLVPREGDLSIDAGTLAGDKRINDPVTFKAGVPFFVMLTYKDPGTTGSFTLEIRKNHCASWDEAEWLDPFTAEHMAMSGPPIGVLQSKCYFKLRQDEALASGGGVEIRALAANLLNSDQTVPSGSLSLYRADHTLMQAGAAGTGSAGLATSLGPSNDFLYLVAERSGAQQMTFDIVWTRNLTTIDITRFLVRNQDDDNSGDEVKIFWSIEDAGLDVWPVDPDSHTANGQLHAAMTYFYDGLATGGPSSSPELQCAVFCPLAPALADSHRINIAFPDALWGMAWEIDTNDADDPLFHDFPGQDGRFRIAALDPDPAKWIHPGDADHGALVYAKELWADHVTYSHGYRLDATRKLRR